MNNDQYQDYLKQVTDLDENIIVTKESLKWLYESNEEIITFFKSINNSLIRLTKSEPNFNQPIALNYFIKLKEYIPILSKLKYHISTFDFEEIEEGFARKIKKHFDYIENQITINEVQVVFDELKELRENWGKHYLLQKEYDEKSNQRQHEINLKCEENLARRDEYDHIQRLEKIKKNGY